MTFLSIIWDLPDDPDGNVRHIADHDVSQEEVEEVLRNPEGIERSRSSAWPIAFGETAAGRIIAVVHERIGTDAVYPITAYEVEP
jgi:translation elongation factor EF-1beta